MSGRQSDISEMDMFPGIATFCRCPTWTGFCPHVCTSLDGDPLRDCKSGPSTACGGGSGPAGRSSGAASSTSTALTATTTAAARYASTYPAAFSRQWESVCGKSGLQNGGDPAAVQAYCAVAEPTRGLAAVLGQRDDTFWSRGRGHQEVHPVIRRPPPVASALVALFLVGCGGSSQGSQGVATAQANCTAAQGTASGERLIGSYSTGRFMIAYSLAQVYRVWVSGQSPATGAPTKPLCTLEREAAAAVVLQYAAQHEAEFAADSAPQSGGKDLIAYLQQHGVQCGSACTAAQSAQGAQVEAQAAAAQGAANSSAAAGGNQCLAVEAAATKLVKDDTAVLQNTESRTTTALNEDIDALTGGLTALRAQANAAQQAQIASDVSALEAMKGSGGSDMASAEAQVIGLGLGASPVKQLPALVGQVCD